MPIEVKSLEQIKTQIDPTIENIKNTELSDVFSLYIILAIIVGYIFRSFLLGLIIFSGKLLILGLFVFVTYTLFFI
jgi:uncharacterized membrane protein required for colicin V production